MNKRKGVSQIFQLITTLFGAAQSHPFVAGLAVGMLVMYVLMLAYARNPYLFEDMRVVCETGCLVVIGGK